MTLANRQYPAPSCLRALLVLALLSSACVGVGLPPASTGGNVSDQYAHALATARYPTPDKVSDMLLVISPETPGLSFDEQGRVLVHSWTKSAYYSDPSYESGFNFRLYGETWFTTGSQVYDVCSRGGLVGEELDLRIEQLLGLPPGGTYDAFLSVWVEPSVLRRPCADPDIMQSRCTIAPPLSSTAPDAVAWKCATVTGEHGQWLCNTWVDRYSNSAPLKQYPWTALGYTFDWSPSNASGVGVSEFVVAGQTEVVFHQITKTSDFCVGGAASSAAD